MRSNWYWDLMAMRDRVLFLRRWVVVLAFGAAVGWGVALVLFLTLIF